MIISCRRAEKRNVATAAPLGLHWGICNTTKSQPLFRRLKIAQRTMARLQTSRTDLNTPLYSCLCMLGLRQSSRMQGVLCIYAGFPCIHAATGIYVQVDSTSANTHPNWYYSTSPAKRTQFLAHGMLFTCHELLCPSRAQCREQPHATPVAKPQGAYPVKIPICEVGNFGKQIAYALKKDEKN